MTTTITITARDLRPGDIVIDEHGNREHAVFDVEQIVPPAMPDTRIFTANSDQQLGWPPSFVVTARTLFTVIRTA